MLKSYKAEINPTLEQIQKINKTIGTCRFIYNFYLAHNKELHDKGEKFMTAKSFSVWLNNEFIPNNPEFLWIKEVSSKSVKKSMENACTAFTKFFKKQSNFPRFKKKNKSDVKMYFVKNNPKDCFCERHRINIPTLGWVKLKEKGYLPTTKQGYVMKSGTISCKAGRYYVSVLIDIPKVNKSELNDFGLGVDLGVKEFAVISNGTVKKNINKSARLKKLEKQLKREQRCLSRKYEDLKKRNKKMKGEATRQNIQKQVLKVQRLHHRIDNIRTDYINKTIAEIVKTKPSCIIMEDLNIRGMLKNRHIAKALQNQLLYFFRHCIEYKSRYYGDIQFKLASRKFPSSKKCSSCGNIKKFLSLSDRTYVCECCGIVIDRDLNAAINLKNLAFS